MAYASVRSDLQMLARDAELAGAAMGCRYLSSAEYEADLIAERRRAGAYARPVWRPMPSWLACAIACAAALMALPFVW
jgi:hypothetical protein